jgi:hypothetical protein
MNAWTTSALDQLCQAKSYGYRVDTSSSAEPVALAAMALAAHERHDAATPLLHWLVERQTPDGNVGIDAEDPQPGWPTPLAILAWRGADQAYSDAPRFASHCSAATDWLLRVSGVPVDKSPAIGHDPALIGWPWVLGTHSWIEPTAWAVLALKACGHSTHARTREAVTLLIDRQLPRGGCNYGNTSVLGQMLRPHLQPTGITLLALAGESDPSGRVAGSLAYLSRSLAADTPAVSLAYGVLGLTAHRFKPAESEQWLAASYGRVDKRGADPLRLALLLLAAAGADTPLIVQRTPSSAQQ